MNSLLLLAQATAPASAPADENGGMYGTPLDFAIIIGYFLFILGFGSYFGRFSKSTKDFFFSGQRFSWWLITMSMVATGVGSYSFIKYSAMGFEHGLSSSMTYWNDWFFIPLFMFGWLPLVYYSRVKSVPDYFKRRFNSPARLIAVLILLAYLLNYIGYTLYTLGVAAEGLLNVDVVSAMSVIAVISAIYITAGGQTAVIFTDLIQGFMLFLAGFVLLFLGLDHLALDGTITDGLRNFWTNLGLRERLPFAKFNQPEDFNFVGIFWQDGMAGSITFLFINQGLLMRFLAAKSMTEGRKVILFNTLFLLPLSVIIVGNAGWVGNAMVSMGLMDGDIGNSKHAFIEVAKEICRPGLFGFILAALSAALMSTIDTLTNAVAAVTVYDIYQPYVNPRRSDRHYLRMARVITACTSVVGFSIGLIFIKFQNIYAAHGLFTAAITPPLVAAVFLAAFWKRFTSAAAFATMVGGTLAIVLSFFFPEQLIGPFAALHGMETDGDKAFYYIRAFYGLTVSAFIGIGVSFLTKPKTDKEIEGLWIGTLDMARRFFKRGEPNHTPGEKARLNISVSSDGTTSPEEADVEAAAAPPLPGGQPSPSYPVVRLSTGSMAKMKAQEGDILYVADGRWWLGGLRSLHCRAGAPHGSNGHIEIHPAAVEAGSLLTERDVVVEKLL